MKTKPAEKNEEKKVEEKKVEVQKEERAPGVIETILSIITKNGPISREDILKRLSEAFPDRDAGKMTNTIKVQLTGKEGNRRLEKEKKISLVVDDKGRFSIKK
jgi:hypothetical protein